MFAGHNTISQGYFDIDVGYSPNGEDLIDIDTEYVLLDKLTDLSDMNLNNMHWNVRGLLNKQDGLSRLLTMIGVRNKVNVVSLNETWLCKETETKVDIPGYNYAGSC